MNRILTVLLLGILLSACGGKKQETAASEETNEQAKSLLQGIWVDDETDAPFMRVNGDSLYYSDSQVAPVRFSIRKDTIYLHGNELGAYHIERQGQHIFWFRTVGDNVIKLHRSENPEDISAFSEKSVEVIPVYTEVVKRDSVVTFKGIRYRAYVYINPSKMKVVRTTYSDEGLNLDNVYYDNVMHICVYEGKKCLYDSNITKQMLEEVISEEMLNQSILSDMEFVKVDAQGFHYLATACIPGSSVCNVASLVVGFDGKLSIMAGK